MKQVYVA